MEYISRPDKFKGPRSSLAFSIDKIIGNNDKEGTTEATSKNKNVSVKTSATNDEKEDTRRSFQPVKRVPSPFQMEMLKQQEHFQQASTVLKTEMQKRQLTSYFARDIYDVNMNAVPYLHPAFMFRRMCPDEYKAQIFQNLSALHQHWPNFHKETLCTLDSLKSVQTSSHEHHVQNINQLKTLPENADRSSHVPKEQSMDVNMKTSKRETLNATSHEESNQVEADTSTSQGRKVVAKSQKSFSCPECGKLFNAHYNLTRHMPVHTGRFKLSYYIFPFYVVTGT